MKLLADFRARVLSAKVKKAATEEEGGMDQEPAEEPSDNTPAAAATHTEDWSVNTPTHC